MWRFTDAKKITFATFLDFHRNLTQPLRQVTGGICDLMVLMAQISKYDLKDGAFMGISCLQYSIPLSPFNSYNRKESYKTTAANVTLWKRLRIR